MRGHGAKIYYWLRKPALRRQIELRQYTSASHTKCIDELDVNVSSRMVGGRFDIVMAESVMSSFKIGLHCNSAIRSGESGRWRGLGDLEIATSTEISWFNEARLHGELNDWTSEAVESEYRDHLRFIAA